MHTQTKSRRPGSSSDGSDAHSGTIAHEWVIDINWERAVISKCCQNMAVETLMGRGIAVDHFEDRQCREIYAFCVEHVKKYKTPPSFDLVRSKHPDYSFDIVTDAMDAVLDGFTALVKRRTAIEEGRELMKALDDPLQIPRIEEVWAESARRLMQVMPSAEISRYSSMEARMELYKRMLKEGKPPGITMGISAFDQRTLGIQQHELVTIAGWQGTGKTTLGLYTMFEAYKQGKKPLIISLEMEAEALFRKLDVMATHVAYHEMKSLQLDGASMKRWEKEAERVSAAPNDIIVMDAMTRCSPESVHAAMVRHDPDIVLVDYVSLMDAPKQASNSNWEKITYITANLKQIARSLKIPIIAVSQTNKESATDGATLTNISYSRCVPLDTEILTQVGWKRYDQLEQGDQTLGYDDGALAWTDVLEINRYEDRELVRMGDTRFGVVSTPNHRWLAQLTDRKCRAGVRQYEERDHVEFIETRDTVRHGDLILSAQMGDAQKSPTPDEAAFLGWVLSDGSVNYQVYPEWYRRPRQSDLKIVNMGIAQKKPHFLEEIAELLTRLGIKWYGWPREHESFRISRASALMIWEKLGMFDRTPIEFVLACDGVAAEAFMDACRKAEGVWHTALARKGGWGQLPGHVCDAMAISAYMAGNQVRQPDSGAINVLMARKCMSTMQITPQPNADVWCPTTALGTWTMRQNGRIMLTGNSIGQDSDLVFGLHATPEMRKNRRMNVRMLKNRDGAVCEADMFWDMETMTFREWTNSDSFQTTTPQDKFGAPGAAKP